MNNQYLVLNLHLVLKNKYICERYTIIKLHVLIRIIIHKIHAPMLLNCKKYYKSVHAKSYKIIVTG